MGFELNVAANHGHGFEHVRRQVTTTGEHLCGKENGSERRSQLMAEQGEEPVLGTHSRFRFCSGTLGFTQSYHQLLTTAFKFLSRGASFGLVSKDFDKSDRFVDRVMYDR